MDGDASCFDGALEHVGRAGVELPLHEAVHEMDDRNFDPRFRKAVGSLQPEQTAADDDGFGAACGGGLDGADVAEVAKCQHARQVHARHVQANRARAGRQHELDEWQRRATGEPDPAD